MAAANGAGLSRAAVCGAAVAAIGLALTLLPQALELDETLGLGLLFRLRGPLPPPDSVVVVSVSRESSEAVGQTTHLVQWPRSLHADLIGALNEAGARAVAFDILFKDARDAADDGRFASALAAAGNVLLLEGSDKEQAGPEESNGTIETRILPLDRLTDSALATAPFALPVVPFDVSQFWTFGRAADGTPSLPVAAVQAHLREAYAPLREVLVASAPELANALPETWAAVAADRNLAGVMRSIRSAFEADGSLLKRALARLDAASLEPELSKRLALLLELYGGPNSLYLNYYGPARTIRTIPYDAVLKSPTTLDVAGKTVFVGYSEPRQPDQRDFFHSVFSQRTGINLSGVEIGATAFANMLERNSLVPLGRLAHLLLVLFWGGVLGALLGLRSTARAIGIAALAVMGGIGVAYWAFAALSVWLPLLVPIGIQVPVAIAFVLFWNYRELARRRRRIEVALSYYVPAAEVKRLANEAASVRSENRLLYGTCLFTDAEQYTTVAESLHPEALAALMNDYYRAMFRVVERHGGFVSDTAGDSMVAVWTSAAPSAESHARACEAALEILDAVAEFNRRRDGLRLPTRVGLDAGEMLLGSFGAEQRLEYRAIGDIVNTASRIQGLNRLLGTQLLVSESALGPERAVHPAASRDVGRFLLRGKTKPVRLYELRRVDDGRERERDDAFAEALKIFQAGQWASAESRFAELVERFPADGPIRYYASLAAELVRRPPLRWDGAIRVDVK
jgi:adenylate cyclase